MQLRELLKNQQILAPLVSAKNTNQQSDWEAFGQLLANKNEKMTERPTNFNEIAAKRNDDNPKFVKDSVIEKKFNMTIKTEVSNSNEYKNSVAKPKESDFEPLEKTDSMPKETKAKKVEDKVESSDDVDKLKDEFKAKLKKETGLSDAQLDQLLATMCLTTDSLKQLLAGGEVSSELFAELAETIENLEIDEALDKNLSGNDLTHLKKQLDKIVELLDKVQTDVSPLESAETSDSSVKAVPFETKIVQALSKIISDLNDATETSTEATEIKPEDIRKAIMQAISPVQSQSTENTVEDSENTVASTVSTVSAISAVASTSTGSTVSSNSNMNGEAQANQNPTPSVTPNTVQVPVQTQAQPQTVSGQAESTKQDDVQTEADVKSVEGISMHQVAMKQGNSVTTATIQQTPQLKQEIFTQIMDAIKGQIKLTDHGTSLLVKLQPEQLGNVELKLNIHKGVVLAEIKVENEIVKAAIESNLDDLKQSLSNKGYSVDQINVNVDSGKKDRQEAFEFNQQERRNRQNQKNDEIGNLEPIETSNKYIVDEYEGSTINYYG